MDNNSWKEIQHVLGNARMYGDETPIYRTDSDGHKTVKTVTMDEAPTKNFEWGAPKYHKEQIAKMFGIEGEWEHIRNGGDRYLTIINKEPREEYYYKLALNRFNVLQVTMLIAMRGANGVVINGEYYDPQKRKNEWFELILHVGFDSNINAIIESEDLENTIIRDHLFKLIKKAYPKSYLFGENMDKINVILEGNTEKTYRVTESQLIDIITQTVKKLNESK